MSRLHPFFPPESFHVSPFSPFFPRLCTRTSGANGEAGHKKIPNFDNEKTSKKPLREVTARPTPGSRVAAYSLEPMIWRPSIAASHCEGLERVLRERVGLVLPPRGGDRSPDGNFRTSLLAEAAQEPRSPPWGPHPSRSQSQSSHPSFKLNNFGFDIINLKLSAMISITLISLW